MLAGDELGEIFRLLRVAAPAADLVDAEVGVGAIGQADRSGGARDFLLCDYMVEIAEAKAAPFLLDRDPVQAKGSHLRPQVAGEPILGVDFGGQRRDLVSGEACGAFADHVGGFAQGEIEIAHWPLLFAPRLT